MTNIDQQWREGKTLMRMAMYKAHVHDCENTRQHFDVPPLDWHTFKFRVWPDFEKYVSMGGDMKLRRRMQCIDHAFNLAGHIQRRKLAV